MAFFEPLASFLRNYSFSLLICGAVYYFVRNRYRAHLRKIPGPFLASMTDLWAVFYSLKNDAYRDYALHRKYDSPLLRLGPNTVAVSDPEAIRVIYGYKRVFPKSRLYIAQTQATEGGEFMPNLASTMDEQVHARLRRPVMNSYAMTTLVDFEPLVDSTTDLFIDQMRKLFVDTKVTCPLGDWLQIGELTFSKRLGFLESGKDVDALMHKTHKVMDYAGIMGHFPTVDEYIRFKWQIGTSKSSLEVVAWTMKQIRHHMDHHDSNNVRDFLSRFIQAREKYPEVVDEGRLADYTITNVIAGSDTTAIALREIIYQISTHPVTYNRLMAEIKSVLQKRTPDQLDKHITWTEGRDMVYLQACIKESLRYHPAICQILPRLVPEGGVELCDQFLPAGTVVGCNAFTIHRDRGVFGEDAEIWRPERWLDPDVERVRRMDNLHFAFGGGTRGCIGRNIAMLEVTKFVPEFFRTFDLHLVDPRQYRDHPVWIAPQSGLDAKLSMRDSTSGVGQFSRDRE